MAAVDRFDFLFRELGKTLTAYNEVLALFGALYVAKKTVTTVLGIHDAIKVHLAARVRKNQHFVNCFGPWAVVTGSTDGIGRAYAQELASHGVNIILISRSMEKLKKVAKDIESTFGVKTFVIKADFSKGSEIYDVISQQIKDKEIGILVNNVGVYDYPQYFVDVSMDRLWQLININIAAATMMTHLVLPQMVERGKGAIVNMSSNTALHPTPQMTVYAATKTYLDYFSRSLQYEYKDHGITVQSLLPSYVATRMTEYTDGSPALLIPSAGVYARHAVSTLGVTSRTTGYWPHTLQLWVSTMLPEWFWMWGSSRLNSAIRRKAQLTLQQREAKLREKLPRLPDLSGISPGTDNTV
ncbi:inactive hydroxysteroid dehydrogenase-like protein 1 [Saccoglossus kowalevskii]|uniref:Inactive hydroxysteroid dehydrogenase-like protein 1-like n=1 Tax=Saccoglossus kowalevskii TaxID=10224 RepID=A0ABM0GMZ8_SACKO|nr:PREDICTED: inactive hydroxysteroid dehydrogenase-like protein 1-like [Saccoglossus kowalevskii]